jgi:hypothetical protein
LCYYHPIYALWSKWSPPFRFSYHTFLRISHLSCACWMPRPSDYLWFDGPNNVWRREKIMTSSLCDYFHPPVTSFVLVPNILLSALFFSEMPSTYVLLIIWEKKFYTQTKELFGTKGLIQICHICLAAETRIPTRLLSLDVAESHPATALTVHVPVFPLYFGLTSDYFPWWVPTKCPYASLFTSMTIPS